jgi:hypothetical protein
VVLRRDKSGLIWTLPEASFIDFLLCFANVDPFFASFSLSS